MLWTHRVGNGYQASQLCSSLQVTCSDVLLLILVILTRLDTVSIQISALKTTIHPLTLTSQGPIKSTAHSVQGAIHISLSGKRP